MKIGNKILRFLGFRQKHKKSKHDVIETDVIETIDNMRWKCVENSYDGLSLHITWKCLDKSHLYRSFWNCVPDSSGIVQYWIKGHMPVDSLAEALTKSF